MVKTEHNLKHVAIIMDGNGRWAEERAHTRVWGHIRGSSVVSKIVEEADELGVSALTLYAFSSENWSRPFREVRTLFSLLKKFLIKEKRKIIKNQVRFNIIGDIKGLPESTQKLILELKEETKDFKGLKLTFAFGYGGRNEIVESVNSFIALNPGRKITDKDIQNHLFSPDIDDVDLLIRTGGDKRISNFLLWQIAYAELFFTKTKWPDFSAREFREIILKASSRERRFGFTGPCKSLEESVVVAKKNRGSFMNQTSSDYDISL